MIQEIKGISALGFFRRGRESARRDRPDEKTVWISRADRAWVYPRISFVFEKREPEGLCEAGIRSCGKETPIREYGATGSTKSRERKKGERAQVRYDLCTRARRRFQDESDTQ